MDCELWASKLSDFDRKSVRRDVGIERDSCNGLGGWHDKWQSSSDYVTRRGGSAPQLFKDSAHTIWDPRVLYLSVMRSLCHYNDKRSYSWGNRKPYVIGMPIKIGASNVAVMPKQPDCLRLEMTLGLIGEFDQAVMNASKVTWKYPWNGFSDWKWSKEWAGKCQHGPNPQKNQPMRIWPIRAAVGCERGSDTRPR